MTPYYSDDLVTIYHGCVQMGRTRIALGEALNRVLHARSGRQSAHEAAE